MSKIIDIVGIALIGVMIFSFAGMHESEHKWTVFWGAGLGVVAIIFYNRRRMKKKGRNF